MVTQFSYGLFLLSVSCLGSLQLCVACVCLYVCVHYCTGLAVWAAGAQNEFKLDCVLCLDSWAQISGTSCTIAFPFVSKRHLSNIHKQLASKMNINVHEDPLATSATPAEYVPYRHSSWVKAIPNNLLSKICPFFWSNITTNILI